MCGNSYCQCRRERLKNTVTSSNPSFYKEVLEHISDGVYILDRDRRIQYWNVGAFRLTGYTAEELVGHYCPDYRICDADDRAVAGVGRE